MPVRYILEYNNYKKKLKSNIHILANHVQTEVGVRREKRGNGLRLVHTPFSTCMKRLWKHPEI